jgi:hypothetical protein
MATPLADNFNLLAVVAAPTKLSADNFNLAAEQANTPAQPTSFDATALNAAAHATWVATSSMITGYRITATSAAGTRVYTIPAANTTVDLLGLTNAVTWTFSLVALNDSLVSPAATDTATPSVVSPGPDGSTLALEPAPTVSDPPVLVSVLAGDGAVSATWTAPAYDGGPDVSSYLLMATTVSGGVLTQTVPASLTTATISGLANATAYTITVAALNALGRSLDSNGLSATPTAGGPPVDPPPPPVEEPPPVVRIEQPSIVAFLPTTAFAPSNWVGVK